MFQSNKSYIIFACIIIVFIIFVLYKYRYGEGFASTHNKKAVLNLYYSPDCGYCHKFMPIWEQFKRQSKERIIMNEVNCKSNKCENIVGYPTIILHKPNGKDITFEGDRTIENLDAFVKRNV